MRYIKYLILGITLFSSSFNYNNSNKNKDPDNLENKIIENNINRINTSNRQKHYKKEQSIKEEKRIYYGNIYNQDRKTIEKTLADDCKGSCLYFPDSKGEIKKVETLTYTFYDPDGVCIGVIIGDGWILLNKKMGLEAFGKNSNDETPFQEVVDWECNY